MGSYLVWTDKSGKTKRLYFDVTESEDHEFTSEITEHAVEKGANVTDHIRDNLDRFTLHVFVSNTPINNSSDNKRGGFIGGAPITVARFEPPILSLNSLQNKLVQSLIPPPPEPTSALVWQYTSQFDAVAETLETLLQLRQDRTLIEVITPKHDYEDMALVDITMPRDKDTGDAGRFSLVFRQLNIVEVQVVTAPIPTETRGATPKTKGVKEGVEPKVEDQESIAHLLNDKIGLVKNGRLQVPNFKGLFGP